MNEWERQVIIYQDMKRESLSKKKRHHLRADATTSCMQQSKHGCISTHGHHQMVNTEIRLIMSFAAKDGEALHSQQKQDWELTMAQIMNSLLPNSD